MKDLFTRCSDLWPAIPYEALNDYVDEKTM